MSPKEDLPEDSAKPKLDKRRFWSRVVAASLLVGGVGVAIIDIIATRANSQTTAAGQAPTNRQTTVASSASSSSAATTKPALSATTAARPVNAAQQQAVRNPSQISTQFNPNTAPVATDRTSASASSASPPKTRPTLKPVLKTALAPAAVDWATAVALNKRSLANKTLQANPFVARLPKLQLDKTRLPVLLPRTGTTLKATEASMVSFGSAYSLNLPQKPGINIILYGHRSLVQADKGGISSQKRARVAGVAEDIFLSQTEDGWTASFKRYGVVYTVDVSCDDLEAGECKDDGFIRKAIADMGDVSLGTEALKEATLAGVKP